MVGEANNHANNQHWFKARTRHEQKRSLQTYLRKPPSVSESIRKPAMKIGGVSPEPAPRAVNAARSNAEKPVVKTESSEVVGKRLRRGRAREELDAIRESPMYKHAIGLVQHLLTDEHSELFAKPVLELWTEEELPGYFEVVAIPMDLGTVMRQLKALDYVAVLEDNTLVLDEHAFFADVRRVFRNAIQYNDKKSEFYRHARRLISQADRRFASRPKDSESLRRAINRGKLEQGVVVNQTAVSDAHPAAVRTSSRVSARRSSAAAAAVATGTSSPAAGGSGSADGAKHAKSALPGSAEEGENATPNGEGAKRDRSRRSAIGASRAGDDEADEAARRQRAALQKKNDGDHPATLIAQGAAEATGTEMLNSTPGTKRRRVESGDDGMAHIQDASAQQVLVRNMGLPPPAHGAHPMVGQAQAAGAASLKVGQPIGHAMTPNGSVRPRKLQKVANTSSVSSDDVDTPAGEATFRFVSTQGMEKKRGRKSGVVQDLEVRHDRLLKRRRMLIESANRLEKMKDVEMTSAEKRALCDTVAVLDFVRMKAIVEIIARGMNRSDILSMDEVDLDIDTISNRVLREIQAFLANPPMVAAHGILRSVDEEIADVETQLVDIRYQKIP